MSTSGVACAYCGERHARALEVRECWQRAAGAHPDHAPGGDAPPEPEPPGAGQRPVTPDAAGAPPAPGRGIASGIGLGRSVLVRRGQAAPEPWARCERVIADRAGLERLEAAWRDRVPLVIELDGELRGDESEDAPAFSLTPGFAFAGERLAHAVHTHAVDARGGELRYGLADAAVRLGAAPGGAADVVLPDGRAAVLDGGPLAWRAPVGDAVVVARLAVLAGSLEPFGPNVSTAALAADQLAAVTHPGGAARIIAPAGSGKTRVLTERARHLLRNWRLPGRAVTLVAFNRRAADEMSERTPDLPELQVRTLNALGLALVGRSRSVATIEEREVRAILGLLVDLPRRANSDPAAAWLEALSVVRLGLRPPEQVEADFDGDVTGLPEVFDRFRAVLAERRAVDFDEQVYGAVEVLLRDPAARRAARAGCRLLLVDEFQDLTPAHLLLVRLLAGPDGAVFGVGDDDQTIYGYTGASPEWLIDYGRYFPGAGEHPLEVNYRCPVRVVESAARLLSHNRRRVAKEIRPAPGRVADHEELRVVGGDALAATVGAVSGLLDSGSAPAEVAVLTRVNASLAPVQVALVHRGVPVRAAVDASYLKRNGVQAALAWLRLAGAAPSKLRGADLALAGRRPSRALAPRVIEWMAEQRSVAGLEALAGRLSGRDADKVASFAADLSALSAVAARGDTARILRTVRDDIGLDQAMELLETSRRRLDRSAQTDDLDALVALAALHPAPAGFEAWLAASLSQPGVADGVALSTIHRVKGREWPHVVLHQVSEGLLPHRLATDLEEERRVLHVGLTRGARSVLVVTGESPSRFVGELARAAPATPAAGAPGLPWQAAVPPARQRAEPPPASGRARRAGRSGPAPGAALVPAEATERARAGLRAWRAARAAAERKPAYVYLHDKTIEALAAALPRDLPALARVEGIGPAKLDAYGDDLLALLEEARGPE